MAKKISPELADIVKGTSLYTMESPAKIQTGKKSLQIGVPREVSLQENRVALKPESVDLLVRNGQDVWIENGAGESSNFRDNEYSEAGAKIVYDRKELFSSSMVVKILPPTLEEIEWMQPKSTLISAFQGGAQTAEYLEYIEKKKITAIGYEFIEDKVGGLPFVRAISEIAGSSVMLIAGEYLSKTNGGQGIILGGVTGVPPTKVVIIGAGTVAEYAAKAAIGLGADIQVFDNEIYKLRRLKHAVGHQISTSTIDNATLEKAVAGTDVLIGALRSDEGNAIVVTEEMVSKMKSGSVIIDVSIDQGGCIETSKLTTLKNPVFTKFEVIHYCVPNIASMVAKTASMAISNIFTPVLLDIADDGGVEEMMQNHKWFMKGVYAYKGYITNLNLSKKFNRGYKDLGLLMAVRF